MEDLVPPGIRQILNSVDKQDNIFNLDNLDRSDWVELMGVEDLIPTRKKARVVFFVGCTYSFDPVLMDVTAATIKVLNHANVNYTILGSRERCCGAPYIINGADKLAKGLAKHNLAEIKKTGAKTVISGCPACYRALKETYPEILGKKTGLKIFHTTEYVWNLYKRGKISFAQPRKKSLDKVTYHDPCELGRLSEIYDYPRKIIETIPGVKLVEMSHNRERANCCGAGGGVKAAYPRLAEKIAEYRLEEATDKKVKALTTACPMCELNFRHTTRTHSNPQIQKLDILNFLELVSQHLKAT